jgi:hypothetical protein
MYIYIMRCLATKLMQYAGHGMDSFERTLIAESAAATASRIFHEVGIPNRPLLQSPLQIFDG